MLVLEIKPGECIRIGDDIVIWSREEMNVKLAIEAPRQIPILRDSAKVKKPQ